MLFLQAATRQFSLYPVPAGQRVFMLRVIKRKFQVLRRLTSHTMSSLEKRPAGLLGDIKACYEIIESQDARLEQRVHFEIIRLFSTLPDPRNTFP